MNLYIIAISAAALSGLILFTLTQIAESQPWLMRLLARSVITDLLLHGFVILSFGNSMHTLVAAELAAWSTTLFFMHYRRKHGFKMHIVDLKTNGQTLCLSGGAEELQKAVSAYFAADPSTVVLKATTKWQWYATVTPFGAPA